MTLILFVVLQLFSQAFAESSLDGLLLTPEEAMVGMTPEMKKKYMESEAKKKKLIEEYEALTPEEREKKDEENRELMATSEFRKKLQDGMKSMSVEDKKMFEILLSNTARKLAKLQDPNSAESKKIKKMLDSKDERPVKEKIESPKSKYDLYNAAIDIADSKTPIEGAEEYLNKIVKADKNNEGALKGVAFALEKTVSPIKDPAGIFNKMVNSPFADTETLEFITEKYYNSPRNFKVDPSTLKSIVLNKNVNKETLIIVFRVLSVTEFKEKLEIKKILDSKLAALK